MNADAAETVEQLAESDLRIEDVDGLPKENLQRLKREAGYLEPD